MTTADDANTSPEVMLQFYRMLYPFKSIFTWLNHEHTPTKLFTHREFAFTLQGDVYMRYQSFNTADDLKKQVLAFNPTRFEIGPVYSARVRVHFCHVQIQLTTVPQPRDKKSVRPSAFTPQKRELVFDIDMTDYDGVRTCCSAAEICSHCWGFIAAAVKVLHSSLVDQFGFRHLLWVYSGRRGIHLWISDPQAMDLTDDQRKALVNALTVVEGGKEMTKKVNVRISNKGLPPSLWGALSILRMRFDPLVLDDQNCFGPEDGWETLLQLVPDRSIAEKLRTEWSKDPDRPSTQKWRELGTLCGENVSGIKFHSFHGLTTCSLATSQVCIGGYRFTIHLSPLRCRSFQAPKSSTQGTILCTPQNRACLRTCRSGEHRSF